MSDKEIIEKALSFLITEYKFKYKYETNKGNDIFIYENKNGCFKYYQWPQFGESEFSVLSDYEFKKINLFLIYPEYFALFKKQHSGIKWFFKDKRKDYWAMIATILKHEISVNNSLFGLKVL